MVKGWTLERRKRQAEQIRQWQPWAKSTGPKTKQGKLIASQNSRKNGLHSREMRKLKTILVLQQRNLRNFHTETQE